MQPFTLPKGSVQANCFHSGKSLRTRAPPRSGVQHCRGTLVIECKESRIGKQPVVVPPTLVVELKPGAITCKAGQNQVTRFYDDNLISVEESETKGTYDVKRKVETRHARMAHGLARSLFDGMVEGLSTGFTKTLLLIGVGYRATTSGQTLTLNLGYSNPVVMQIPEGVTVEVIKNTTLNVKGYDKVAVGQFAADIRFKRPPEPYKGKGVRYEDEYVPKKEGKRGKK